MEGKKVSLSVCNLVYWIMNAISIITTAFGLSETLFHGSAGGLALGIGISVCIQLTKILCESIISGKFSVYKMVYIVIFGVSSYFAMIAYLNIAIDGSFYQKQMQKSISADYTEICLDSSSAAETKLNEIRSSVVSQLDSLSSAFPSSGDASDDFIKLLPSEESLDSLLRYKSFASDSYFLSLKNSVQLLKNGQTAAGLQGLESLRDSITSDSGNWNDDRLLFHQGILAQVDSILAIYESSENSSVESLITSLKQGVVANTDCQQDLQRLSALIAVNHAGSDLSQIVQLQSDFEKYTNLRGFYEFSKAEIDALSHDTNQNTGLTLEEAQAFWSDKLTVFHEHCILSGMDDAKDILHKIERLSEWTTVTPDPIHKAYMMLRSFNIRAWLVLLVAVLTDSISLITANFAKKIRAESNFMKAE